MAQRRMFSLQIVDSDAFLDMPISTQLLYFHLSMRADDDGFIGNHKKIMRIIGASDDDIKVLLAKRFVLTFKSGVIVIKHWKMHNYIQKDRYNETQYLDEKNGLIVKDNGSYTECIQDVSSLDTQVRLGKVRLGKDNLVAEATEEIKEKPFNFEEELDQLKKGGKNGKRKDYKIIALYWRKKGFIFENKDQLNSALVRELKPAQMLKGYTGEQIAQAIAHCIDKYPDIYTLETVHKRITDLINKK